MSQEQTAESVEAEAAIARSQLLQDGADIRRRVDPSRLTDAATAAVSDRAKQAPDFLKKQSSSIGLILLGGAVGAIATGMFAKPKTLVRVSGASSPAAPAFASLGSAAKPTVRAQVRAGLLSAVGLGLGYVAGLLVPSTSTEEAYLGQPKAMVRQHLNEFIDANIQGMKQAALNMFGATRLSATALIGLAVIGQALVAPAQKAKRDPA